MRGLTIALPRGADRAFAVENVDLTLRRGRTTCLVGESGSGKSMIAWALLGLLPNGVRRAAGAVKFGDVDLASLSERRLRAYRGARLSLIAQEPASALNPTATIATQIREAFAAHPGGAAPSAARMADMLAEVGLSDPARVLRSYPHQLSGGQRQRAVIAMALALEPDVLIADEPTTALDVTTQAQVLDLIRAMQRRRGLAVLFVTHDFSVVEEMADDVAVMQSGRIVESGPADRVLDRPTSAEARRLIAAAPGWGAYRMSAPADEPLLDVADLCKRYPGRGGGGVDAARSVALHVRRGETLGIVGESGSGKSTVARCVARLIDADRGAITLGGVNLSGVAGRALRPWRSRVQMIFQDARSALNPRMSVGAIISEGLVSQGVRKSDALDRVARLLEIVGLEPAAARRHPHAFSGGQRQRIAIARALAVEPELLIADEPVSALDATVQEQILDLLDNLTQARALSMVFVTHDLRVAGRICDRIAVMRDGRVVEVASARDMLERPQHPYAKALVAAAPGRKTPRPAPTEDFDDSVIGFAT